MHVSYPRGTIQNPSKALDDARNGALKSAGAGARLRSEQNLTVSGAHARRLAIDALPPENLTAVQLLVVRGDSLYQAVVVMRSGSEDSADARRFISSLAFGAAVKTEVVRALDRHHRRIPAVS